MEENPIEFLKKDVPSKIFLILMVYKNGEINGKPLGPVAITRLIYPDKLIYTGGITSRINKLESFGLVMSKREVRGKKKIRILYPNLEKFAELFIEYYKLDFTEEEKEVFKKWFKEVDWSILVKGTEISTMVRSSGEEFKRNIFEIVGDMLKVNIDMINIMCGLDFLKSKSENLDFLTELLKNVEIESEKEKISASFYVNFLKQLAKLPKSVLEKLSKINYSVQELVLLPILSSIQTALFAKYDIRDLIEKGKKMVAKKQ